MSRSIWEDHPRRRRIEQALGAFWADHQKDARILMVNQMGIAMEFPNGLGVLLNGPREGVVWDADGILERFDPTLVPFNEPLVEAARSLWRKFIRWEGRKERQRMKAKSRGPRLPGL